jgi:hypothetical protein
MPDLTPDLLPGLQNHRIHGLDLPAGLIHPKYDGGSILNLPATICRLFGVPEIGSAGSLSPAIYDPLERLSRDTTRVILILMDALALHRLRAWMAQGRAPLWSRLVDAGLLAPLTSVVPSTTSTALPTLWSGLSPAEHAMVGYELWLKEYGVVANMITHSPFQVPGQLEKAGFDPAHALPGATLGYQLESQDIRTYAFQHYTIAHSGMSRMFLKDTQVRPFGSASELMTNLRMLMEGSGDERQFIGLYWGQVDHLSHVYGPDDERAALEFEHFSYALEKYLLEKLKPSKWGETLLLLAADHGQIFTPKDPHYYLSNHESLARRLPIKPTGENRLVYFFVRPGQAGAVQEYLEKTFLGQFALLDPGYAIESGLFGPGKQHPRLSDRTGDLLAIPVGQGYLWWGDGESPIVGRHGGLTPEEMLVPLVAARI